MTATANTGTGIYVTGNAATLKSNVADANGYTAGAVSDLTGPGIFGDNYTTAPVGTNTALGNDDPAECQPSSLC